MMVHDRHMSVYAGLTVGRVARRARRAGEALKNAEARQGARRSLKSRGADFRKTQWLSGTSTNGRFV
jgi:hypothetical protein